MGLEEGEAWAQMDEQPFSQPGRAAEEFSAVFQATARTANCSTEAQQRAAIREVRARLQQYGTALDLDDTADEQWYQGLVDVLIPAEDFLAGATARHVHAWDEWLQASSTEDRAILRTVTSGVQLDFVHPRSTGQQHRPQHAARLEQVRRLLQRTVQPLRVQQLLDRATPGEVQFQNRASLEEHMEFVLEEAIRLRQSGAWKTPEELGMETPPILIHGLGVVINRHGKLRLVVDARYLNLFLR